VTPLVELGSSQQAAGVSRYPWLTPDRLARVRTILFAVTLVLGAVVYLSHLLVPVPARDGVFLSKLRGVGILTWIYALVQMVDMRFYNSRFARRRRATIGIPDSLHGWLFGQMLAWFGIIHYGLTEDVRWFAAGLAFLAVSFFAFPIRRP
jgi:hypothetical protein